MEVIKFSTPGCGMCKVVSQMLTKAKIKYQDIDCTLPENDNIVNEYNITHVPTLIVRYDGYFVRLNNIADISVWLKKEGK